ncbi:ExeM/NucH family extracellular endonuclease [Massilia sp. DWR3-1-1]|uniref:ExeM/NucH family extracellular endonuclease n=1 Tax=Massilia sp. DWR3-1-1 TaxID=2804559 RepID=UPI003CF2190F
MNKPVSISTPGHLTVLAALLAALSAPAMAADPATHLVISQVYGGGGSSGAAYYKDFIELFNPTANPISLAGKSVQYASASGTLGAVTVLPSTVTLQPGQYFLVGGSGTAGVTSSPAPDVIGSLGLQANNGKVALVEGITMQATATPTSSTVIDWVAYGASTPFEGTGPTGAISILNAAFRTDPCVDGDNNATEFTVAAVAPRNTASPLKTCGGTPSAPPILPVCAPNASFAFGVGGSAALSASDTDSVVNSANISSAVSGISLGGFTASSVDGAVATVNLNVAANTPNGVYPVTINFGNDDAQTASCTVNVTVAPPAATTLKIYQIQGNGAASTYANSVQTTEGVVTAKVATGFFIQDATGDGDPTTSDAIYVYTGSAGSTVAINDLVRVTATVQEYTAVGAVVSLTELSNPTAITKTGTAAPIAPTNITLPVADFGPYQGMLVRFAQPLTASQVEFLGDRGEITLSSGRLEVSTNRFKVGTPEELALRTSNARNMIILDDGIFVTPTVIPYIGADQTVRAGDTTANLTGVIDLGSVGGTPAKALYKLQPTEAVTFSRDNARPTAPSFAPGNVKVASANVLNFFTTFTNGASVLASGTGNTCSLGTTNLKSNCRGADNLVEFTRQRDKIVNSLKMIDADVVGLMEIQNNGEGAVGYLVEQLNLAYGATTYAVVPKPSFTGTDAIRVAMIYKPSKLNLSGVAITDPDPAEINNRPPMAQTFVVPGNGGKFSLVVNHLKSKGSCPMSGDTDQGEGCWTSLRKQQSARLINNFIPQVQAASGDTDVLLIGDFNSYGMESPITQMTDVGVVNLLERFVRPTGMPYSYVFGHSAGYLDHALATPSMNAQVSGASEFHNNADEPSVIDYNTDGKPQDLYVNNAYRASDHDPVTISLNVAAVATSTDVSASFSTYRTALTTTRGSSIFTGAITLTNTSGAAVAGPLQVELRGLPAGVSVTNASGSRNGVPYITVPGASIAAGAAVNVSLVFSNPAKVTMTYTTAISSGTF